MTGEHWATILEHARWAPSPHNSQPMRVRVLDERRAEVFYDLDRGLPAESFGIPFGHVAAGVFLQAIELIARAQGLRAEIVEIHREMDFSASDRLHPIATVTLTDEPATAADRRLLALFRSRRTNRRPYDPVPIARDTFVSAAAVTDGFGFAFAHTDDGRLVDRIIRVNQETLFRDLQNDDVHAEILHWLRTTRAEAARTGDGLSAETMLLPGWLLGFAMRHRGLWQLPVIGPIVRGTYLRTMGGVRHLGWLTGPFAGPADYLRAGRCFLALWLDFEARGVVLHPLGTVITNPASHAEFVESAAIVEREGEMAWMLFRLGHAPRPPAARRRPVSSLLVEDRA
ncbi:hypothetical protein [Microbacterium marinilacus]|uniref:Nitroreductase domain-containing protein n=1 Tax=Microbacterium marinilacus TaxID=415209 RepID=A0ABP7BGE7_9MICO|nr:hypothetical protein [Microbacterium marinilacus]MBY0690296.1 hypothetical protein [Microbacterium marinilacus]